MTSSSIGSARAILAVNASARLEGSVTRAVVAETVARAAAPGSVISHRDLALDPPPFVDASWIDANFTAPEQRSTAQDAALAASDALVDELEAADLIVIGAPIYNFSVPAALKAWIDQVARARRTFRYTETGPVGLLDGKTAVVVLASGGTAVGSEIDFASQYLRHVLGFLGITDVRFVLADASAPAGVDKVEHGVSQIDAALADHARAA